MPKTIADNWINPEAQCVIFSLHIDLVFFRGSSFFSGRLIHEITQKPLG
jgi:hypothetical protein